MSSFQLSDAGNSILVVVDFQKAFRDILYQGNRTEAAINRSIDLAGLFGVPVILTEQYPAGLGETTEEVRRSADSCPTLAGTVDKGSFSCCGDEDFMKLLSEAESGIRGDFDRKTEIILTGIETHVCVLTTAVELLEEGYRVSVLEEAVSSRKKYLRDNGLNQLRDAGVRINNTETVGFEWAKDKDHDKFKQMSNLLKQFLPEN